MVAAPWLRAMSASNQNGTLRCLGRWRRVLFDADLVLYEILQTVCFVDDIVVHKQADEFGRTLKTLGFSVTDTSRSSEVDG